MHLLKTAAGNLHSAATAGKSKAEQSAKNVLLKTPSAQLTKSAAPLSASVTRSVSSLISAAGLPADKLSASIVSFARFFSLPLKPNLLADIRRIAFTSAADIQPEPAKQATVSASGADAEIKNRVTLSLAASAAESKGVELQPKGFEAYAEAVDPDWQRRQDNDRHQRGRRNKNHGEHEKESTLLKTGSVSASGLKELFFETEDKNPLLYILNRLPGKNGQRWIVLPFSFSDNEIEYKVSMRVLLDDEYTSGCAACLALDIAANAGKQESNGDYKHRWLFALESANDKPMKLTAYLPPEILPETHCMFAGEFSRLLELPPERISVKTMTESFPFESGMDAADLSDELLRAIDEEA
ncbi:MAG: hypothetical protein FWC03_06120 [Treponema sp.]|nr:hypothetical protein [Treponema sp.]